MKKYPKIRRIGDRVNNGILQSDPKHLTVKEKLDGANFRFTLDRNLEPEYQIKERKLVFGSRNVPYKNERDIDSSFQHAIKYVRENVNVSRLLLLENEYGPLTFFGEAMHSHTINYDWDDIPSFIGFDIWSQKYDEFLTHQEMETAFDEIGLKTTPTHPLNVVENEFDCPESKYYDGPAEGVVIVNDETGQRAKIRGEKFKEVAEMTKQKNDGEYNDNHSVILANRYATDARILKKIHKMEDVGRQPSMEMMETLWRSVFEDIIEEEFEEIFLGNYQIDTKEFRSEVASNTADVLQQYLQRPDDSVLNELPA